MKFDFGDRVVDKPLTEMTPRFVDSQFFFDEWLESCSHVRTKGDDTLDWRMIGLHRYFGAFIAKWVDPAKGDGLGVDGRVVVVVSEI